MVGVSYRYFIKKQNSFYFQYWGYIYGEERGKSLFRVYKYISNDCRLLKWHTYDMAKFIQYAYFLLKNNSSSNNNNKRHYWISYCLLCFILISNKKILKSKLFPNVWNTNCMHAYFEECSIIWVEVIFWWKGGQPRGERLTICQSSYFE